MDLMGFEYISKSHKRVYSCFAIKTHRLRLLTWTKKVNSVFVLALNGVYKFSKDNKLHSYTYG